MNAFTLGGYSLLVSEDIDQCIKLCQYQMGVTPNTSGH